MTGSDTPHALASGRLGWALASGRLGWALASGRLGWYDGTPRMETAQALAELDESALVELARQGEDAAFSTLVSRYHRKVFRLAKNITQNDEDAEDVLQDAFLKAYTHLDRFHGDSKFYTWVVRIAVNEALMKLRKRRSSKTVSLDDEIDTGEEQVTREIAVWDGDPEQKYGQAELRQILDEAMQSLKPAFRTVFQLRDVEELSTEETAEALELSVPAVKSRLLRARLQLRERLTKVFKRKGDDALAYM
jgi:RNA polymerase sigma-70 factor (ECF subfamily)